MRTLRPAVVAVVLALIGGVATIGATATEMEPMHGSGTLHRTHTAAGDVNFTDGAFHYRGSELGGTLEVSDRRLSGELWSVWNYDELGLDGRGGTVAAGTFGVENEEGSWSGTFTGIQYPGSTETLVRGWLAGADAFDGLSAYLSYVHHGTGPMTVESMVFPGRVPPYPEAPTE